MKHNLQHVLIVDIGLVHAVGSSNGWHFIVFEYIEGTNLRDLVRRRGPLTVAAVVDISMQIAAAAGSCQSP